MSPRNASVVACVALAFLVAAACTGEAGTGQADALAEGGGELPLPRITPTDLGPEGDTDAGLRQPAPDLPGLDTPAPHEVGPPLDVALPDAGPPPPPPCPPLAERLTVTEVSVAPEKVTVGSLGGFSNDRPVHLSPIPGAAAGAPAARIGWSAQSGPVRITSIDDTDHKAGADLVVEGSELRGFVAHADGAALLVRRKDVMALVRVDAAGEAVFEVGLVGNQPQDVVGNKWIDSWDHQGRLVWTGEGYGVYFGHTQLWDSGKHQGDMLRFYDGAGGLVGGGWGWGCSHSLDVRLAAGTEGYGPVCLSDCYPGKGIYFNHQTLVFADKTGNCSGSSNARLGGVVPDGSGYWLSFASAEGRLSRDVGLRWISQKSGGGIDSTVWLTDTADVDEQGPQLAAYGPYLLVAWVAGKERLLAVASRTTGEIIDGPISIEPRFGERGDFASWPGGDVAWAYSWDDTTTLKVVRVSWCQGNEGD